MNEWKGLKISNSHSKYFGPSSVHTWAKCPYSAVARNNMPDTDTRYAKAGTLAHSLCEAKLKYYFKFISDNEYDEAVERIKADPLYDPQMLSNSEVYRETVAELAMSYETEPIVYIEHRVKYDDICGEDGFGTSDCILLGDNKLTVIDYKNGSGVYVSAKRNPQMMLYAYGALHSVVTPGIYNITEITMCIVQPNLDNVTVDTIPVTELLGWIENTIRPAVARIKAGDTSRHCGSHCAEGFCPNLSQCSAWIEKFGEIYADHAADGNDVDSLTPQEAGRLLEKYKEMSKWAEKLERRVEADTNDGKDTGWKFVEGRRSRAYTDMEAAFKAVVADGIAEDMLYERRAMSPSQLEKFLGKTKYKELAEKYVAYTAGKPALVPMSDKRSAINSAASDFEEYSPENKTEKKGND